MKLFVKYYVEITIYTTFLSLVETCPSSIIIQLLFINMSYWYIGLQLETYFPIYLQFTEGKAIASWRYTDTDEYMRKPADQLRYKTIDNRLV